PGLVTGVPLSASASPGSIDLGRSPIAQRLMGALLVVEPEVGRQARLQLRYGFIVPNVDVFVFERPDIRYHSVYAFSTSPLRTPRSGVPSGSSIPMGLLVLDS